jgi:hypothetical protein
MIFDYNGKQCGITVTPTGVIDGFYTMKVRTSCDGRVEEWKEAVPVQTLRNRADAAQTDIQTERDSFVVDVVHRAQNRFKDVVDLEALNDGI